MSRKLITMTALLLGFLLITAGCGAPIADVITGIQAADLMADVKAAEKPAAVSEPDVAFIQSVAGFSWNLFLESAKNDGNILISPTSVYLALAMTLNGADTETRSAMLKALSAGSITVDLINKVSRDWMTLLIKTSQNTKLTIANSIWYREGFNADRDFLQRNADYFAAGARTLDFNNPKAPDTINNWVKQATNGTIEKIIDEIKPEVMMYLINAVYFKAEWQTVFLARGTVDGLFTTPAGQVTAKFMNRVGSMDYLSTDGGEGVLLPYKDGRYAFAAILPANDGSPRELIGKLTADRWLALLKSRKAVDINLRLPKFETKYEDSLSDDLKSLGMDVAFDARADFSLMNAGRLKNLYISEVKHKTFCRVDELGTEAAAVTSVEVSLTGMPVSDKTLTFDRPFLYGIVDTITGLPLFLGIMENPAE